MKRALNILLILIIIAQGGGLLFVTSFQQCLWKLKVWSLLEMNEKKSESTFNFSSHEFDLLKINKREFMHNGAMYDIKNIEAFGDSIHVLAYLDIKDNRYTKFLGSHIGRYKNERNPTSEVWKYKLFSLQYILPIQIKLPSSRPIFKLTSYFIKEEIGYSYHAGIYTPPEPKNS